MFGFAPSVKTLNRVDLDEAWTKAQQAASHNVAEQAARELGYKQYSRNIDRSTARAHLQAALRETGIQPFDTASVTKYKALMANARSTSRRTASWFRTGLSSYEGVVPEFALQTALTLRAKLPEVRFEIEHLEVRDEPTYDPFLVAVYGGIADNHREYIEVWNEPEFAAKRQV